MATGYFRAGPRGLESGDAEAVRAIIWSALGVTPYVDEVMALLAAAERSDRESRVQLVERDGTVASIAFYGPVAGSNGTWQLSMFLVAPAVDARDIGRSMLDSVVRDVRLNNGRLLVAELPADPVIGRSLTLLRANGFRQEGRVPNFFRDGVALLFLRREL